MKRVLCATIAGALLLGLPACGKREDKREEVQRIVRRTAAMSGQLAYFDQRDDRTVRVDARFSDDFKYAARVATGTGSSFTYDEYVVDDVLALRLRDPSALEDLVDESRLASAKLETEIEGVSVPEALEAKRWVVDVGAAPYLSVGEIDQTKLGIDPVYDAMTVLDYIDAALVQSQEVVEFDPDSLDPAYNRSEDIFPKPASGSGVTRYDLRRPRLPAPTGGAAGGRAEASVPRVEHFRKMAIYVQDGRILQVREAIEIRGKQIEDFARYFRVLMKETKTPKQVQENFEEGLRRASEREKGTFLLGLLNLFLRQVGEAPVIGRTMNLEFKNLGTETEIALPTDGVVKGDLDFLVLSAAAKVPAAAGTAPAAGAGGAGGAGGGAGGSEGGEAGTTEADSTDSGATDTPEAPAETPSG